ncbi:MAG: metal ABC transporter permease [Thermodesulfobacteriota bacterium]
MPDLILPLLVSAFVAASASLLGSFAILRRMALVGDALSHVALPGLAIAILLNVNPFIGAVAFLLVTVTGIWVVQYKSTLSLDTVVGVFFTASLALGALIMPEHELIEALFGNVLDLGGLESVVSIVISLVLIALILSIYKRLTLNMVSSELAHSVGISTGKLDLVYLLIFAVTVALGIRFVGALMMGSLVIIPAASAKNIARSLKAFMGWSMAFGVAAAAIGIYISYTYALPPGPIFILVCAVFFMATLLIREVKKKDIAA